MGCHITFLRELLACDALHTGDRLLDLGAQNLWGDHAEIRRFVHELAPPGLRGSDQLEQHLDLSLKRSGTALLARLTPPPPSRKTSAWCSVTPARAPGRPPGSEIDDPAVPSASSAPNAGTMPTLIGFTTLASA